jgi:dihydropteroate synthase
MFTLNCNRRILVIDKPLVMGIINVTPDSFYAGSRAVEKNILKKTEQMIDEGAHIIDIGGQSTRPGSEKISADEELKRVIDPIIEIRKSFPDSFISVDTFYAKVAKQAVEAGADIVNDISAGKMDKEMIPTISGLQVPYVLMHMKGTPDNMQKDPAYEDATKEVLDFFIAETDKLKKAGIYDVFIDIGFGFGKKSEHNFELLRNLSVFKMLDRPILLGISRKSTISKTLGVSFEDSLNGTTILNTIGLMNGANILRVHDVKEAKEAVKLFTALNEK